MVVAMVRPVGGGDGGSGGAPKGGMNIFAEYLITSRPFRSRARPPSASATRPSASDPPARYRSYLASSSCSALCRCRTSFRRLSRDDDDDDDEDDRMESLLFRRPTVPVRPSARSAFAPSAMKGAPPSLPPLRSSLCCYYHHQPFLPLAALSAPSFLRPSVCQSASVCPPSCLFERAGGGASERASGRCAHSSFVAS